MIVTSYDFDCMAALALVKVNCVENVSYTNKHGYSFILPDVGMVGISYVHLAWQASDFGFLVLQKELFLDSTWPICRGGHADDRGRERPSTTTLGGRDPAG